MWETQLRQSEVNSKSEGLPEFILHHNFLGSSFILRVIDFAYLIIMGVSPLIQPSAPEIPLLVSARKNLRTKRQFPSVPEDASPFLRIPLLSLKFLIKTGTSMRSSLKSSKKSSKKRFCDLWKSKELVDTSLLRSKLQELESVLPKANRPSYQSVDVRQSKSWSVRSCHPRNLPSSSNMASLYLNLFMIPIGRFSQPKLALNFTRLASSNTSVPVRSQQSQGSPSFQF